MKPLSRPQIAALQSLGEPGHFLVGGLRQLSGRGYQQLRERGLIEEHWTWASTTRPDVGITPAGVEALAAARAEVRLPTGER